MRPFEFSAHNTNCPLIYHVSLNKKKEVNKYVMMILSDHIWTSNMS